MVFVAPATLISPGVAQAIVATDEHPLTSLLKVTSHSPVATGVAVTGPALLLELRIVQVELTCAQLFWPCSVAITGRARRPYPLRREAPRPSIPGRPCHAHALPTLAR